MNIRISKSVVRSSHVDGCLHFNRLTVQEIGFVFVLANRIKDRLAEQCGAGYNLGKQYISIFSNFNDHYNCA